MKHEQKTILTILKTDRTINEGIIDHNKHDKNSHILKHFCEVGYSHVWEKGFKLFGNNYCSSLNWKIRD